MTYVQSIERVQRAARSLLAQVKADSALRGITGKAEENAPDRFDALCRAIESNPGGPVPVATDHSGASVFGSDGNTRFRAWHDMEHYTQKIGFGVKGELAIEEHGARRLYGADVLLLHKVEIIGQTLYYARHGCYPVDQRAFTVHAFQHGIRAAIERGGF